MLVRSLVAATGRLAFAVFAIFGFSAAAQAQFVTFVSNTGVDTRPCTVQAQPCRTLQRAVTVTGAGGTVRILSDLAGQAVTIGKSLTVEGGGNAVIATITINSASAVVTLRGLHLTAHSALASGIIINSATAVHIEDCTVERYTNDGIKLVATTGTKLFVVNTASHDNGSDGLYVDAVNALVEIQNSRFEANASTGLFLKAATASVLQSVASGNIQNGIILRTSNAKVAETTANDNGAMGMYSDLVSAKVQIEISRFEGNGSSGLSLQVAKASITHSVASGNAQHGILLNGGLTAITDTTALGNSQHGFSLVGNSTSVVLKSAETAGNGVAGLSLVSGTIAVMTDCSFWDVVGVKNQGLLGSYKDNKVGVFTGTSPDQYLPY